MFGSLRHLLPWFGLVLLVKFMVWIFDRWQEYRKRIARGGE